MNFACYICNKEEGIRLWISFVGEEWVSFVGGKEFRKITQNGWNWPVIYVHEKCLESCTDINFLSDIHKNPTCNHIAEIYISYNKGIYFCKNCFFEIAPKDFFINF